ncbi:MAG: hypothetical protein ACLPVY_27730 [Acidimicrobiia bacterium]
MFFIFCGWIDPLPTLIAVPDASVAELSPEVEPLPELLHADRSAIEERAMVATVIGTRFRRAGIDLPLLRSGA